LHGATIPVSDGLSTGTITTNRGSREGGHTRTPYFDKSAVQVCAPTQFSFGGGAGAGRANFAPSMDPFIWISFNSAVDCPSVQVAVHLKGTLIPRTSR